MPGACCSTTTFTHIAFTNRPILALLLVTIIKGTIANGSCIDRTIPRHCLPHRVLLSDGL